MSEIRVNQVENGYIVQETDALTRMMVFATLDELMKAIAAAKAEIAKQAKEIERIRAADAEFLNDYGAVLNAANIAEARVEELERLLRLCVPWIDANLVVMETGEFLRPVILKALETQPKKETPHDRT